MPTNDRKRPARSGRQRYAHARPSVAASKRAGRPKTASALPQQEPAASAQGSASAAFSSAGTSASGRAGVPELLLSRRGFLYGAVGVAAAAVVGTGAFAAAGGFAPASETPTLSVPEDGVFTTDDCAFIDDAADALSATASLALPYGSMVWASDPAVAACLLPTESGSPLTNVGLISLGSGALTTVLDAAVGAGEGYQIFDARATSDGVVWTEADILDGNWRVYQAPLSGLTLGAPVLVHEGNADWEMPTLAASGSYAFWQVLPQLDGAAATEDSLMLCAQFGAAADATRTLFASHGRMACSPSPTATGIACAPRADTETTNYQLTHIDAATGQVTDALVLPAGMKPIYVAYGASGFAFSFDGIYNYGDGIANLGTYTPVAPPAFDLAAATTDAEDSLRDEEGQLTERAAAQAADRAQQAVCDLYSTASWFRFPRTPVTPPAWYGDWFIVKSTRAVSGVNLAERRYFALDVENGAPDYGEFLASYGTCQNVVTYTNIDYTPLNGDTVKECRVKVWA